MAMARTSRRTMINQRSYPLLNSNSPLPHPITSHTKLVPIRIAEARDVVILVVHESQARRAVAGAAVGQH
jgi:hypothetical protein